MKRILTLLVFLGLASGVNASEELTIQQRDELKFWEQKVNVTTEWGQWMVDVLRPYSENFTGALMAAERTQVETGRLAKTAEELIEQVNAIAVNQYTAVESVTPPDEFEAYHAKVLELYKLKTKTDRKEKTDNAKLISQLADEANEMFAQICQSHDVPQKIIDHFAGVR